MAKFNPGSIISEIRGSVGDVTYSRNAYGPYVKQKLTQTVKNTAYQIAMREALSEGVLAWKALSQSDYLNWLEYVQEHVKCDQISNKIRLAAYNEFTGRYLNRALISGTNNGFSATPSCRTFSKIISITDEAEGMTLNIESSGYTGSDCIAIYATGPQSTGIHSISEAAFRLIGFAQVNAAGQAIPIQSMYLDRFPFFDSQNGKNIRIAIKNVNSDNYASSPKVYSDLYQVSFFPATWAPEYQAIIDYGTSQGYRVPTFSNQFWENFLMERFLSHGFFTEFDVFYNFETTGDENYSLINWISPGTFQGYPIGTPSFSENEGWSGDGSSAIGTNYVPSTDGILITNVNVGLALWYVDNAQADSIEGGVVGTNGYRLSITAKSVTPVNTIIAHSNAPISGSKSNTNSNAWVRVSRTNINNYSIQANNSNTNLSTPANTGLPDSEIYFLALNNAGVLSNGSIQKLSQVAVGTGSGTANNNFYFDINLYKTLKP